MTMNQVLKLSNLTERVCVIEALNEYDELGSEQFFATYYYHDDVGKRHTFAPATSWPLYYRDGKVPSHGYPSKAIAAVAHFKQHGQLLWAFSGGLNTVVSRLEILDPSGEYFRFRSPFQPTDSDFRPLMHFLENQMQMQAIYQPVMVRTLLQMDGKASRSTIAREILLEDNRRMGSQIEYERIVKQLPGQVLEDRNWVTFDEHNDEYALNADLTNITKDELDILINACEARIWAYQAGGSPSPREWSAGLKGIDQQQELDRSREELEDSGDFNPDDIEDARRRIYREIVLRQGQKRFREALLNAYQGKCAITGYDTDNALEACHILPYKGLDTNYVVNGLLLRADIHTLFDLGKIAVDTSDMTLILADELKGSSYEDLAGRSISLPIDPDMHPSSDALYKHRRAAGL